MYQRGFLIQFPLTSAFSPGSDEPEHQDGARDRKRLRFQRKWIRLDRKCGPGDAGPEREAAGRDAAAAAPERARWARRKPGEEQ